MYITFCARSTELYSSVKKSEGLDKVPRARASFTVRMLSRSNERIKATRLNNNAAYSEVVALIGMRCLRIKMVK